MAARKSDTNPKPQPRPGTRQPGNPHPLKPWREPDEKRPGTRGGGSNPLKPDRED